MCFLNWGSAVSIEGIGESGSGAGRRMRVARRDRVSAGGGVRTHGFGGLARRVDYLLHSRRRHFFGGGGVFTGAAFAPFFGFFGSFFCELLPLPTTDTSVRDGIERPLH